jgi:hypothetical protein
MFTLVCDITGTTVEPTNLKPMVGVRVLLSFSQPGESLSCPSPVRKWQHC